MAKQNLSVAEFADCSVYLQEPRGRVIRHAQPDGTVKEEVLPRLLGECWVTKTGAVLYKTLTSSQSIQHINEDKAKQKRDRMRRKGLLRYAECPLTTGTASPEHFEGELRHPCAYGKASERQCCPHVAQLIEERRTKYLTKRRKRIEAQRTQAERSNRNLEALVEHLLSEKAAAAEVRPKPKTSTRKDADE
jgi:hypothetical protein